MTISRATTPVFSATQASTTLTCTLPTHATDDYLLVLVGNGEDNPQPSITGGTITTGYTPLGALGFIDYGPGGLSTHLYYKKATSSSETSPTVTWNTGDSNGGGLWALAVAYRSTGTWHATTPIAINAAYGVSTGSSSTPQPPEGTGTISLSNEGVYAVHFLQTSDNNTCTLGTANGWSTPAGGNTTEGSDGSIYVTEQLFVTSGTKNAPVWSLDLGPDYYSWRFVELMEAIVPVTGYWMENGIRVKA